MKSIKYCEAEYQWAEDGEDNQIECAKRVDAQGSRFKKYLQYFRADQRGPERWPRRSEAAVRFVRHRDNQVRHLANDGVVRLFRLAQARFVPHGRALLTPVFDAGTPDTVWDRLILDACIPAGCSVMVEAQAADTPGGVNAQFHRIVPDMVKQEVLAAGFEFVGYAPQGQFLLASGLLDLAQADDEVERVRRTAEVKRLTLPGEMGTVPCENPRQGA